MHDGMPYDPIQDQGQGHETFKFRNSSIFFNFQNLSPWPSDWLERLVSEMTCYVSSGTLNTY